MYNFVNAVKHNVETENWYSALTVALTIPDICGRITNPEIRSSQTRFENWFNSYVGHHYKSPFHGENFTFLSGADCYALRCALLHEGSDDITRQRARDVVSQFTFSTTGSHRCMFGDRLVLNLQSFCSEICEGVEIWQSAIENNDEIQQRLSQLLEIKTGGFEVSPGIFIES